MISAAVLLCACGGELRPPDSDADDSEPGDEQMLALPSEPGHRSYLRTITFKRELVTPEPVLLDRDYSLEFIPLSLGDAGEDEGGCSVATYVLGEAAAQLVDTRAPLALDTQSTRGEEIASILTQQARIDLSPYTGQSVSFRWVLYGERCRLTGGIGNLKLYPHDVESKRAPRILFVGSDTHRYDHALTASGRELMPNLQRLRQDLAAVTYHHTYSTASWTAPAIASLLTGRFPREHGTGRRTWNYDGPKNGDPPPGYFFAPLEEGRDLVTAHPSSITTLSEHLSRLGYTTVFVFANGIFKISDLWRDGQDIAIDASILPGEQVTALAKQILESLPDDRPIFLLVHYMDAHHYYPWCFQARYGEADRSDRPDEMRECYADAVTYTDQQLGELLSIWKKKVEFSESLVVFYSDHGEHLLDNAEQPKVDHGITMEDVLLRVPLVIKYPAHLDPGERDVDYPTSLIDVVPTVFDALGVDAGEKLAGISLLGSAHLAARADRPLYADFQLYEREMSSVRSGPFKLVLDLDASRTTLIDTRRPYTDAGEEGQAVDDAQREVQLRAAYDAYVARAQARSADLHSNAIVDREESIEKLRALGYVE